MKRSRDHVDTTRAMYGLDDLKKLNTKVANDFDNAENLINEDLVSDPDAMDVFFDHRYNPELRELNCAMDQCCNNDKDDSGTHEENTFDLAELGDTDVVRIPGCQNKCYKGRSIRKWLRLNHTDPLRIYSDPENNNHLHIADLQPVEYVNKRGRRRRGVFYRKVPSQTEFVKSCLTADYVKVTDFLKNGVNPNNTDSYGRLILPYAAQKGDTHLVNLLLQHNADPNKPDPEGFLPLVLLRGHF